MATIITILLRYFLVVIIGMFFFIPCNASYNSAAAATTKKSDRPISPISASGSEDDCEGDVNQSNFDDFSSEIESLSVGCEHNSHDDKHRLNEFFHEYILAILNDKKSSDPSTPPELSCVWHDYRHDLIQEKECFITAFTEAYKSFDCRQLGLGQGSIRMWADDVFLHAQRRLQYDAKSFFNISLKVNGNVIAGVSFFKRSNNSFAILSLYVHPAYWRQGLGLALVFAIALIDPHVKNLVVAVRKIDTRVNLFFHNGCGFKENTVGVLGTPHKTLVGYEWNGSIVETIAGFVKENKRTKNVPSIK